jgi:hypothetical protein
VVEPIKYTNRKGVIYYLHIFVDSKGRTQYRMRLTAEGALPSLPDGFSIHENVNGLVSVRRGPTSVIPEEEEHLVASFLNEAGFTRHRVEIKGKYITIYESPFPDIDEWISRLPKAQYDNLKARWGNVKEYLTKRIHYEPVFRFLLVNVKERLFDVQLMLRDWGGWPKRREMDPLPLKDALSVALEYFVKGRLGNPYSRPMKRKRFRE